MNKLLSFVAFFSTVIYAMDQESLIKKQGSYSFKNSLEGHTGSIDWIAFNPADSDELISSSSDKTIRFWDVKKGVSKMAVVKEFPGRQCAVSPNGNFIAYGDMANRIKIIERGYFYTTLIEGPFYNSNTCSMAHDSKESEANIIQKIVFHPKENSTLISALRGYKYKNMITLFNHNTRTRSTIETHRLYDFAVDPCDGKNIIVGSRLCSKIYDSETQQSVYEFSGTQDTHKIIFNPSNPKECIFYKADEGFMQLFDSTTKKPIKSFCIEYSGKPLQNIAVCPDGKEFLVTSEDQTHIFELSTGKFIESLPNKKLSFIDITFNIFSKIEQSRGSHTSKMRNSVINTDGTFIATHSEDDTIKIWQKN